MDTETGSEPLMADQTESVDSMSVSPVEPAPLAPLAPLAPSAPQRRYDDFHDLNAEEQFDPEIKDDVLYETTGEPSFKATRALFLGNLKGETDKEELEKQLKTLLSSDGSSEDEVDAVESVWVNPRRSHAIVIIRDIEGATSVMKEFGSKWYVEYVPVKAVEMWIDQEKSGPKNAVWKVEFADVPSKRVPGTTFKVATHKMLNYPNRNMGYKSGRGHRSGRNEGDRSHRRDDRPRERRRGGRDGRRRDGGRDGGRSSYRERDYYRPEYDVYRPGRDERHRRPDERSEYRTRSPERR